MRFAHRTYAMEVANAPPPWSSEKLTYDLDGELADLEIPSVSPFTCETERNDQVGEAIEAALASGLVSGRMEIVEECGFRGRGPDTFRYFDWALAPECHRDAGWLARQTSPAENPVGPRLRYVAERYPAWVTLATIWSLSEATGEHEARSDLLGGFVPDTDVADGRVTLATVARYEELLGATGGATATRYDRHIPWLAREFGRIYKPIRKRLKRQGQDPGLLPGWDYSSLTLGWIPPSMEDDHGRTLLADLVGPTQKLARQFRSIVDWNEAKGDDLNRYSFAEASWEAEDWAEKRKLDELPQGEVVYTWPDGWTVQALSTEAQLEGEGDVMQHCVGGYDEDRIGIDYNIYSLRDPRGMPHATMEWEPDEFYVVELKGKQNSAPIPAYLARLAEWRCRAPQLQPDEGNVVREPDSDVPDHADGLRERFLGMFSLGEHTRRILVYADGTIVPIEDYERFLRQTDASIRALVIDRYGSFDQCAFDQGMVDTIDHVAPGEIGEDEVPAWAEFEIWRRGAAQNDSTDAMVEYLSKQRHDPRTLCPPGGAAPNPNPPHDYGGIASPTPPGMPLHPTNAIRVRLRKGSGVTPAHLYASLVYIFNRGYFQRLAHGTCQQSIRQQYVKDVPVEGGRRLKDIATVTGVGDPDSLRVGDVLLQRIGQRDGCGRPYIVVGVRPLETRGQGFRGGRAAGRSPRDFDARQLEIGTRVEMEHTTSRRLAQRIAMDHLTEHHDYYIELAKMEAMLRARRREGNPWIGASPAASVAAGKWRLLAL